MKTRRVSASIAIIAAMAALTIGCAKKQQHDFIITGNMEGIEGPVYLLAGADTLATATSTGGKFTLSGLLPEEAGVYSVAGGRFPMRVLLGRGDSVNFTGSFTMKSEAEGMHRIYTMSGSRAVEGLTSMRERIYEIGDAMRGVDPQQINSLLEEQKNVVLKTIEDNTDNILGMYIIANEQFNFIMTADMLSAYLAMVPEKFKTTTIYGNAEKRIEALRAEELKQATEVTSGTSGKASKDGDKISTSVAGTKHETNPNVKLKDEEADKKVTTSAAGTKHETNATLKDEEADKKVTTSAAGTKHETNTTLKDKESDKKVTTSSSSTKKTEPANKTK